MHGKTAQYKSKRKPFGTAKNARQDFLSNSVQNRMSYVTMSWAYVQRPYFEPRLISNFVSHSWTLASVQATESWAGPGNEATWTLASVRATESWAGPGNEATWTLAPVQATESWAGPGNEATWTL